MPDLTDDDRKFARDFSNSLVPPTGVAQRHNGKWVLVNLPEFLCDGPLECAERDNRDELVDLLATALAPIRRSLEPVLTAGLRAEVEQLKAKVAELEAAGAWQEAERTSATLCSSTHTSLPAIPPRTT